MMMHILWIMLEVTSIKDVSTKRERGERENSNFKETPILALKRGGKGVEKIVDDFSNKSKNTSRKLVLFKDKKASRDLEIMI